MNKRHPVVNQKCSVLNRAHLIEQELHKTPLFYAATRLLQRPKTLIHQRCIKSCINDKNGQEAKPLILRGLAFVYTSENWFYVN